MVTDILGLASVVIDKVGDLFPSKAEKDLAKVRLIEMQQRGEMADIEMGFELIKQEAKSKDPFTSRARPSFMYVFYLIVLLAIPLGIVSAFAPNTAVAIADGMRAWWDALPSELWYTFMVGFTGYSTLRTIDKARVGNGKKKLGLSDVLKGTTH